MNTELDAVLLFMLAVGLACLAAKAAGAAARAAGLPEATVRGAAALVAHTIV
jgi:hypothetical protein